MGILVLLLGLVLSVALHELGHMLPAKKFGVGVPEYAVGFGPSLFAKKIGPTTYHIRAIPLGGYVRILGMLRPNSLREAALGAPIKTDSKELSTVEQARAESATEIAKYPNLVPFYTLVWWKKVVVMAGGIITNAFLAFLFTVLAVSVIGVQRPTTQISQVPTCAQTEACGAARAGLKPGDVIVAIGDRHVNSWEDITSSVSTALAGKPIAVQYRRAGNLEKVEVEAVALEGKTRIGIVPSLVRQRDSLFQAYQSVGEQFKATAGLVINLPHSLWIRVTQMFGYNLSDRNVPISVVGIAQMGSQIGSAAGPGITWLDRLAGFLSVLAALNMALFVFNLIPLLPLDGGQVVGALYEGIRGQWRRILGKHDVGAADMARMIPLSYAVGGLLLLMTVILVVADFVAPLI
ncbi:site-2 protease family protein [Actinomycetaceae bacterium TAE3-ERU4]|nr:site-2 protease family protein [Actinomycetaceae bacterium TAE3-ERU4]